MGHVEAQGLDHGVLVLEIKGQILVLVRGEELPPGLRSSTLSSTAPISSAVTSGRSRYFVSIRETISSREQVS